MTLYCLEIYVFSLVFNVDNGSLFYCALVDHSTISTQHTKESLTTDLKGGTVRSPLDEKGRFTDCMYGFNIFLMYLELNYS